MSHPAFLLKEQIAPNTYHTIAGLRVLAEMTAFQCMTVTAAGIFVSTRSEVAAKRDALEGHTRPMELSFEDGRRVRGSFTIDAVHYAGDQGGERNHHLHLRSVGPVETLQ